MPELFEVIAHNGDGIASLPEPEVPYYVIAKEGYFLHRKTQIGNALIRELKQPNSLGRVGYANGVFTWTGEKIPGSIISQAHDFFKRIYDKHHAEAEVLITMHNETNQFRLFVPFQRVTHMGVKSVYEPTHIHKDYTVVGTLHSHCDFTAFHSGTDSSDASEMDGVHFTIGKVDSPEPQIVAMVSMAGKEFHYKDPSEIADIEYGTATAPPWWDQYVFPAQTQSEKPKSLKSITQAHWDEFRGMALKQHNRVQEPKRWTPQPTQPVTPRVSIVPYQRYRGLLDDFEREAPDWRDLVYGAQPLRESVEFNRNQRSLPDTEDTGIPELDAINAALDIAEKYGAFTDDDWNDIKASEIDEIEFWRGFFTKRMDVLASVLTELNMNVSYSVKKNKKVRNR